MKRSHGLVIPEIRPAWIAIALLVVVMGLLGGSSRPDAVQLIVLRPLSGLLLCASLFYANQENMAPVRTLLFLLIGLAALMALQLVPLPPGVWQLLPGRQALIDLGPALNAADAWRPLSLVPARTLNSLASLVVPFAVLIAAASSELRTTALLGLVAAIGVADALLGIFQVLGAGSLYFYSITNIGSPVGLFANQNHSGVFSAMTLVILAKMTFDSATDLRPAATRVGFVFAFLLVLVAALLSGSRAGLLMTLLALFASVAIAWLDSVRRKQARGANASSGAQRRATKWATIGALLLLAGLVTLFVIGDQVPGLRSLLEGGSFKDLRWEIMPVLGQMMAEFAVFGSGFGSFEEVYHIFEPDGLLQPDYINQAHNDWAQIVIEGGALAVLLVACCSHGSPSRFYI